MQHLLGTAPFRHLELAVGPGVFIPRPETELLAGWVIEQARRLAGPRGDGLRVVDLCSGSGAIALAVAQELPGASVVAVERSPAALEWLRRNAAGRAAAGDTPVEVVAADVTAPDLLAGLTGRVDLLAVNPPYVPDAVEVPAEVAGHDPAEAVFGGPDGLAVIRPLIAAAAAAAAPRRAARDRARRHARRGRAGTAGRRRVLHRDHRPPRPGRAGPVRHRTTGRSRRSAGRGDVAD